MQQGRRSHTQGEHLRIVQALEQRDMDALPGLMNTHIGRRLDQITDVIRTGFSTIYMRDQAEPATAAPANTMTAGEKK
ncbi:hypothetical protein G6F40_016241 [Rhizopus arrhizus]|nr:hypothetical protein G6F40_016241 [Rhizopus arrhizus]